MKGPNGKRSRHNKAERAIARALARIEALPEVRRVLLGRRVACSHAAGVGAVRVVREVPGGLLLRGHTEIGVREIRVLSDDPAAVERAISAFDRG